MPNTKSKHKPRPRRRRAYLSLLLGALALAAGVWLVQSLATPRRTERTKYIPGTGALTFPASVETAAPDVRELYEFAVRRPDVLHYLPCYCGCGRMHKSNYDCFIDEVRPDGTVLIDRMRLT